MSSSSELDLASWPRRLIAGVIDAFVVMAVLMTLLLLAEPDRTGRYAEVTIALLVFALVYHVAGTCNRRISLGRRIAGIAVVPLRGATGNLSVGRALWRWIVRGTSLLLALFIGVGLRQEWMVAVPLLIDLVLIWRTGRRSVADLAAGTLVVKAPVGHQHREPPRSTFSLLEVAAVTCICFGLFIFSSLYAVAAGASDVSLPLLDRDLGWLMAKEAMLTALALAFLRWRHFDIGSLYPAPTLQQSFFGLGLFVLSGLMGWLATTVPLPSLAGWPSMTFSTSELSFVAIVLFAIANGAFEEVFLLGFLVRGLRTFGLSVAVSVSLLVRVLYHLYQGPEGALWVAGFGLTLSLAYVAMRRVWPAVLAHALWDIGALL
jgi:membrane protease YdiL (CAAX protease family)